MVAFFCFRGLFFEKSEKKIKIFKFFFTHTIDCENGMKTLHIIL